jgi:drug/metabolite transporter (DMT)-like permease
LWATLFGYLVFEQVPCLPIWVGAAIVIIAAIFTIYRETRRTSEWTSAASVNQ